MATTLAVVSALLVALAIPDFITEHIPGPVPLVILSLTFVGMILTALPLALLVSPSAVQAGLWIPVAAVVGLLLLEPLQHRELLPDETIPWLVGLSMIALSCIIVAELNPVRAGAICAGINAALASAYAERLTISYNLLEFVGLGLISAALIAGVRALRARADRADAAEQDAQRLFENHQRQVATETERVRTDALLHDNVLAALLTAAAGSAAERAASMARSALQIFSDMRARPTRTPSFVPLGHVLSAAAPNFEPIRDLIQLDFSAVKDIPVPPPVAETLAATALQALINSVNHAGPAAHRSAVAVPIGHQAVRITISDDGVGFDPAALNADRLGVRMSILERAHLSGVSADISSLPGHGTTVTLEWHPSAAAPAVTRRPGETLLDLVPRRHLYRVLGVVIVVAVLIATIEAFLITHAYASVIASVLGLLILPTLIRGARRGTMSNRAAWGTTVVSCLLCCIATIGLDPAAFDYVLVSRYTCGVLAGAVMGWMAGRRLPPVIAVAVLLGQVTIWAGPAGVIRLGLAGEIVVVIAALLMYHAIRRVTAAALVAAEEHCELATKQAELDAFDRERQRRLSHASRIATPVLARIVDQGGELDERCRAECGVLEQALRDEIRGRRLLNDAVRNVVAMHRRRGALVQVLDDGGLERTDPDALDALLDEVARRLEPLRSSRIVIRTSHPESDTAITIVASTPDETAVALGLDGDDAVDLWVNIARRGTVTLVT